MDYRLAYDVADSWHMPLVIAGTGLFVVGLALFTIRPAPRAHRGKLPAACLAIAAVWTFIAVSGSLYAYWRQTREFMHSLADVAEGVVTNFRRDGRTSAARVDFCVASDCFVYTEGQPIRLSDLENGSKLRVTHMQKKILRIEIAEGPE